MRLLLSAREQIPSAEAFARFAEIASPLLSDGADVPFSCLRRRV
jgi:hypothetical protein